MASAKGEGSDLQARYLCFGFNRTENRELLHTWLSGKQWQLVKNVGIRLYGQSISETDLDFAVKSARRVPQSRIGKLLKRWFLRQQYRWVYHRLEQDSITHVLNYNGLKGVNYLVTAASRQLGLSLLFWEVAPLPDRLQIDYQGINYGSSIPREIGYYRRLDLEQYPDLWRKTQLQLRQPHRRSKIQHKDDTEGHLDGLKYVFCPLQVPTDSQITIYGGWIDDLSKLVEHLGKLAEDLPEGFHFRLKEHPSSPIALTEKIRQIESDNLRLDNETNTLTQMQHAHCVLTVNSTAGLEAFHFEKPVITLGQAFYAFAELTVQATSLEELQEVIRRVDSLTFSASDRDLFLRFLYQWFPTRDSISTGKFSESNLIERDAGLHQ